MKLKGVKLGVLLCIVTFSASAAGYVSGVRATQKNSAKQETRNEATFPKMQSVTHEETELFSAVSSESDLTQTYVLREHEGKIALFMKYVSGNEAIHDIYDVSVSLLPSSDREQLKKGIICDSLSDALQLVEDYSS